MPLIRISYSDSLAHTSSNPFLLEGLIPAGVSGLLVAPPAWGKTSMSLQIALSLVTGLPCLGITPTKVGHVVLVELEASVASLSRRIGALLAQVPQEDRERHIAAIDERLHLVVPDHSLPFEAHTTLSKDLLDLIDSWGLPEGELLLVIVDSLAAVSIGDENAVESIRDLWSQVGMVCGRSGASVLLLHHTSKTQTSPGGHRLDKLDTEAVRGSSAIAGFARFILQGVQRRSASLWLPGSRRDEFQATLRLSKWNDGPTPEDLHIIRSSNTAGFWERVSTPDPHAKGQHEPEPKVWQLFRAACAMHETDGSVCRTKLERAAKAIGMSFRTGIHALRKKGLLDGECQLTAQGLENSCGTEEAIPS